MGIRAALDRIVVIQAALTITDPITKNIRRAYAFMPSQNHALTNLPCWTNEVVLAPINPARMMSLRDLRYEVHMQLFVAEAAVEDDRSAKIAAGFYEAALDAFCADVGLAGTVTRALLRGGQPTFPAILERYGAAWIGVDLYLDIDIQEEFLWA